MASKLMSRCCRYTVNTKWPQVTFRRGFGSISGGKGEEDQTGTRRVVVTGMGAVTPLGIGVQKTWQRLVAGHTAVHKVRGKGYGKLPCQVAAEVFISELDESQ